MNRQDISPAWLKLSAVTGLSTRAKNKLIEPFGSADLLLSATDTQLMAAFAGNRSVIAAVRKINEVETEPVLDWLKQPGNEALSLNNPDYPELLKILPDAPTVLYYQGDKRLLGKPQLAVVGSRRATPLGRRITTELVSGLCRSGLGITSGLALGIDSAAHQAALDAESWTVAVAATGLDRVYPVSNYKLASRIRLQGVVVSEYPPGTGVTKRCFPQRNRLISGLSLGTLVVEAACRSGSLITARMAGEQGREVFAVPGSIKSALSTGCHALLSQGAKLVESAMDIIEELPVVAPDILKMDPTGSSLPMSGLSTGVTDPILAVMGQEMLTLDEIVDRSGLTVAIVSAMLLRQEIEGRIACTVDGRYQQLN